MSRGVPLRKTLILLSFLLVAAILWPIHVGIQVEKLLREDRVLSVSGLELRHFVLDYRFTEPVVQVGIEDFTFRLERVRRLLSLR